MFEVKLITMGKRGFTLVESLVVLGMIAILAAIAISQLYRYRHVYVYQEYASSLEMTVRQAKIMAMERTTNVGVCVRDAYNIQVMNLGVERGAGICSGTPLVSLVVNNNDRGYISFAGSGFSLDPRGFAIQSGNVCVQNTRGNNYLLICVSRFGGIRTQRGSGACPSNC